MGTVLKSEVFQGRKVVNKNELTSGVNDGNVIKLESVKREKQTSEKNPEIELFSTKIGNLIAEIISEVSNEWEKKSGLFKYFPDDGLKNIDASTNSLNDKMLISGFLMNEGFSNSGFSDEEKLLHIKYMLISEYKDKIESLLNLNSHSYNNAFVINFLNK